MTEFEHRMEERAAFEDHIKQLGEEVRLLKEERTKLQEQLVRQDERLERGDKLIESQTIYAEIELTYQALIGARDGGADYMRYADDQLLRMLAERARDWVTVVSTENPGMMTRRLRASLGVWRVHR